MNPFYVLRTRGRVLGVTADSLTKTTTHTGTHDDYDLAAGPKRSLTARSDKALTSRDMRMPVDLVRSRRVGLSKLACVSCQAPLDDGRCLHERNCQASPHDAVRFRRMVTGPMLSKETSADVGWRWET